MSSTFFGLTIAASGLRAANAALNTTGNNISNADTVGYSRQEVKTEAANALRVFSTYGCAGAGVETLSIERVRDEFYDRKYRDNETKLGEYDTKAYYMRLVEDYLTDDNVSGFKSLFNDMSDALESISTNSSSSDTKLQFISSVKSMTDYFNNLYGDLQNMQADINDEIKIRVDHINSIAQELATVNKQINTIEMTGSTANELRDKRDTLLDELSAVVDVDVTETPIYDSNGNATGATRCIVRIAGGQTLVDQNEYNQLVCVARSGSEKVNQTDVDGLYDIQWTNGVDFGLYNSSMGGELAGLIQLRDGNNGEYFTGTAASVEYNGSTSSVTVSTAALYLGDMSKCNLSDTGGIINIGDQLFYYDDWSFDTETGEYTFIINNEKSDKALTSDKVNKSVSIGGSVEYQGIPYYMEQMNEWIRGFAEKMNDIFTDGVTEEGEDAGILFTGSLVTSDGQYTEDELNDSRGNGKGYYYLTAGNLSVAQELIKDASLLGTRSDATNGVEECEQVKKAISLLTDKNQYSFRGRDAGGFLECVLSDAALNASNANTFYDTYLSMELSIDNQRISISGVDEDEEALNLIKYEYSFTLASKMISTLTEVYDRLILETGV